MTEIVDHVRLPPEPASAGAARRFVANALGDDDAVTELAVLLVSEVASNAIVHAKTWFDITLHVTAMRLRVEVSDGVRALPVIRAYAANAESGRGMHIVAATAARWGCEPSPDGKCVWFELDRGRG